MRGHSPASQSGNNPRKQKGGIRLPSVLAIFAAGSLPLVITLPLIIAPLPRNGCAKNRQPISHRIPFRILCITKNNLLFPSYNTEQ